MYLLYHHEYSNVLDTNEEPQILNMIIYYKVMLFKNLVFQFK